MAKRVTGRIALVGLALVLSACSGQEGNGNRQAVGPDAPANEAELAEDAALANEAAAAEAADMAIYGGNAAAETANSQ